MSRALSLFCLCLLLALPARAGDTVRVAVASNFLATLKLLGADYQARSGDRLLISSASTGKLYAQIRHGAPFEVFLAANAREPERLEQEGLTVPGSRFTYALGQLVLWAPGWDGPADDWASVIRQWPKARIALANPATAPYGAAAHEALRRRGLLAGRPPARLVRGENVAQAFQHVASGATRLGFVAWSQLKPRIPVAGRHWLIEPRWHPPIRQQAVLLKGAADRAAPRRFLRYLAGPHARRIISGQGYRLEPAP